MIDYFRSATPDHLRGMGVEPHKLPDAGRWYGLVAADFEKPLEQRSLFYTVWILDDQLVGHSHINDIVYSQSASMHLHLWQPDNRQRGNGSYFIKQSIALYFDCFQLKELYCEPYALNPAPNKTLARIGFDFLKEYETTPGWLSFSQPVNRWVLTKDRFETLF